MNLTILIVISFVCLTMADSSSIGEVREGRDSPSAVIASYIINYQRKHRHKKYFQALDGLEVDEARSSPVGSIGGYITSYWEKKKRKKNKTKSPKHPSYIKTRKPCFYYNYSWNNIYYNLSGMVFEIVRNQLSHLESAQKCQFDWNPIKIFIYGQFTMLKEKSLMFQELRNKIGSNS